MGLHPFGVRRSAFDVKRHPTPNVALRTPNEEERLPASLKGYARQPMPTLDCSGTEIDLAQECILGRHRSSGLQVKDEAASRQHAKVYVADGLWWVEDLGSANGTSLNGSRITSRKRLRNNDKIGIGQTNIMFSDSADGASGEVESVKSKVEAVPHADIAKLIGTQIAGYRIDRYLGRGMLGAVYHAHQLNLDRPVAFKVFDPERCIRDARLANRFLAEAGKVGSISDDGLVQLHESGEANGLLWCSMEWIEGDTLEKLMQRDGTIAPELALLIVDKVASAVGVAHSHDVIHGDLRPSHIILMADGRVKLTDVGMMGIFEEGELPSNGPASVAWYLSPEEAAEGASDPRSDVYSLGCLLFHLLTGKPPFAGVDTGAVIAAHAQQPIPSIAKTRLPAALDAIKMDALIHGMLAKNPEWRHATMAEVRAELQPIRDRLSGNTAAPDVKPALRRPSESRSDSERPQPLSRAASQVRLYLMLILVFVGLAALVALILPHLSHAQQTPDMPSAQPDQPLVEVRPTTRPGPAVVSGQPTVTPRLGGPVSTSSSVAEAWAQLQVVVDQAQSKGEWSAAELALAAFAPQAKADPVVARVVNQRQQQLTADGDVWYQQALAKLPGGATPVELANRLRGIDGLRDQALSDNRPDAESRYQEALTKLGQRLNAAKRQARQALESGRVLDLPKIASDLAPAFAQTPVTDLHRQFSLLCNEAAGTKPVWVTSWAVTKPKLLAAKGADALAAAAALVLAGDIAEAKALLANDPLLGSGDLLRRREAIFGRKAAVLTFEDPDDLQYIDVMAGNPRMSGGTLTGSPGEVIAVSCAAPIGLSGWGVALGVSLEQALVEGQAVVSLVRGDAADAQIRIEKDALFTRVRTLGGWQEVRTPRPETKVLRLRLSERGGTVTVLLNDQVLVQAAQAKIAPASVLRFEASGMVWALTDLQVVGGE